MLITNQQILKSPSLVIPGLGIGTTYGRMESPAINPDQPYRIHPYDGYSLLTPEARREIITGRLPDFSGICRQLFSSLFSGPDAGTAHAFIPVMKKVGMVSPGFSNKLLALPQGRIVLVQNDWMKVVLIAWKPGELSSVHGHPAGGCVFKALYGKVEEKRFSPDTRQEWIRTSVYRAGAQAYIDDTQAFHTVGNPFSETAVSLHAYTPGKR